MSAVNTNTVANLSRSGNVSVFAKIVAYFAAWNDARVTRNALAKLSDRELSDIGLSRFDAENIGR